MTATNWQTDNILCDLSHLGLLAVSGDDAITFLQGQVTNDVKALDGRHAHFSAYCSPKGRMLALFLAFKHHETVYLQFNQPLLAPIMKRLNMYVMRSKVDISDVSAQLMRLGVNGPQAAHLLSNIFSSPVPTENYSLVPIVEAEQCIGVMIKLPTIAGHQRFELLINAEQANYVQTQLHTKFKSATKASWDWLNIQTGLPEIVEATQEQFVPQMLNLDKLNGISFKKGCYTGQEIVARTHYLGAVKRRTYLATIEAAATNASMPSAGDKVLDASENDVGQIVSAGANFADGFDALIEMRIEAKESGNVSWNSYPIKFKTLPYTLEKE